MKGSIGEPFKSFLPEAQEERQLYSWESAEWNWGGGQKTSQRVCPSLGLTLDPVKLVPPSTFLTDITLKDLSES